MRIAVYGAGAVGCYFGGMLARGGLGVTLVGRAAHIEAIQKNGLRVERGDFDECVRVDVSTDVGAVRGAEIVLVCVKSQDTGEAGRTLAPHVGRDANVLSLQNGVDNAHRLRAAGVPADPAVVYVAAEMKGPGHVRHNGRGELALGEQHEPPHRERLVEIAELFSRTGVPTQVSDDITAELWTKMVMNCAYNALSALTRSRYGPMVRDPGIRRLMQSVVEETVAVARAEGVSFSSGDLVEAAWRLADTMPGAISSMAQDLARGRRTEIDSLNGYVVGRGAERGIPTPVNEVLCALLRRLSAAAEA